MDAQVLAISADPLDTQARFRAKIGAPFAFIADPDAELINLFGVKTPVVTIAKRTTFVVGTGRKILYVDNGNNAIDPNGVISALQKRQHGSK